MSHQRVPFLRGSKKHFDCGYKLTQDQAGGLPNVSSGANYPLGIDFATYMKWMWRVQQWQLTGNFSFLGHGTHNSAGSKVRFNWTLPTYTIDLLRADLVTVVASEKYILGDDTSYNDQPHPFHNLENGGFYKRLLFGGSLDHGVILTDLEPGVTSTLIAADPSWGLLVRVEIFKFGDKVFHETGADNFWPWIRVEVNAVAKFTQSGGLGTANPQSQGFQFGTVFGGLGTATGALTLDGLSVSPLYLGAPPSGYDAENGVSLTLTPSKFWEYRNRSGQPVYDSATGAQLNDPFD